MSYKVLQASPTIPEVIRQAFGVGSATRDEYRLLWRDVAARLTLDAFGITGMSKKDKSEYRELLMSIGEAQSWFVRNYDDVQDVFELANVDMHVVRLAVLEHMAKEAAHVRVNPRSK